MKERGKGGEGEEHVWELYLARARSESMRKQQLITGKESETDRVNVTIINALRQTDRKTKRTA